MTETSNETGRRRAPDRFGPGTHPFQPEIDALAIQALRTTWLLGCIALLIALFFATGRDVYLMHSTLAISIYQVVTQDLAGLAILLTALPLSWLRARYRSDATARPGGVIWRPQTAVAGLSVLVLSVGSLGSTFLMRGYALSADEFMAWFQVPIFLNGDLLAPVPPEWQGLTKALQPYFVYAKSGYWGSGYKPGNSLLLAIFERFGAGVVMNAVIGSLCVVLIAAIARMLWPQERWAPVLAAGLLAVAPQFLVTSMTTFAMTGHLFAALLWLWLFLRDRPWAHAAAILVGCFAIGLHQVHVYLTVAFPFVAWLAGRRRWMLLACYGLAYAFAFVAWSNWFEIALAIEADGRAPAPGSGVAAVSGTVVKLFDRDLLTDAVAWPANFIRFISWQNLSLLPLLLVAWRLRKGMPVPVRLLGWSVACLIVVHALLMPQQGYGWGYRYIHPVLGHLVLLAVYGWYAFRDGATPSVGSKFAVMLVALGVVTAIALIPLRFVQAGAAVAPAERSYNYIRSLDADIVFVDKYAIHIGLDLVRNDPHLRNRPKILDASRLSAGELEALCVKYSARFITQSDVAAFGKPRLPAALSNRDGLRAALVSRLRAARCLR